MESDGSSMVPQARVQSFKRIKKISEIFTVTETAFQPKKKNRN